MEVNLFIRFLKSVFELLWKLFLNLMYLIGKILEVCITALNTLLKNYI